MKPASIETLEAAIEYRFKQRHLLEQALTHSTHAHERKSRGEVSHDNEQMEFLGDAVLGVVTSEELFKRFPHYDEGELSKLKAHLVSARYLVAAADQLRIGDYLRLGRGEEVRRANLKSTMLVDALEAIFAAVYLDGGYERARDLILARVIRPELERLAGERLEGSFMSADFKSRLQETLVGAGRPLPEYVTVKEEGPEHRKTFTVRVILRSSGGEIVHTVEGNGPSKKSAEQAAAQSAFELIKTEPTSQASE